MIDDLFNPRPDGADALEQGFFAIPMSRSGRIDVPLRIWFGPPEDPEFLYRLDANSPSGRTRVPIGQRVLIDRSWRWQIEINGVLFGDPDEPPHIAGRPVLTLEGIWPEAKRHPLHTNGPRSPEAQVEYEYRVARADYAESWDENDPYGGTGARVDPMTATLPEYRP